MAGFEVDLPSYATETTELAELCQMAKMNQIERFAIFGLGVMKWLFQTKKQIPPAGVFS